MYGGRTRLEALLERGVAEHLRRLDPRGDGGWFRGRVARYDARSGEYLLAYDDGELAYYGYMPADGDYGYVVVTRHTLRGSTVWALHGHLDAASIAGKQRGQRVRKGEVLGWLGSRVENGGWPAHVHFQLSWEDPGTHDMPGVVDPRARESALARYPDPRLVLGPLY